VNFTNCNRCLFLSTIFDCMLRILQGVFMDIDGNDFCACIYMQVKQMLIGKPFSPVSITAGGETIEIERDCAVPEPEVIHVIYIYMYKCVCVCVCVCICICIYRYRYRYRYR
jgi:hypothetical protein